MHNGTCSTRRESINERAATPEDIGRAELARVSREILRAAGSGEAIAANVIRSFARTVVARDSLGAMALRIIDGGPGALRHAVELAGAVLALEAVAAARHTRSSAEKPDE